MTCNTLTCCSTVCTNAYTVCSMVCSIYMCGTCTVHSTYYICIICICSSSAMPLHITYMYDMMYRQYITSHITCVVCYMTYTLNVQQQYTVYSRSIQVLQYSACTYVYMQLCMLYLVPLHMSMVYTIYVVLQVCHVWQCHIHSIGICVYHTVTYHPIALYSSTVLYCRMLLCIGMQQSRQATTYGCMYSTDLHTIQHIMPQHECLDGSRYPYSCPYL